MRVHNETMFYHIMQHIILLDILYDIKYDNMKHIICMILFIKTLNIIYHI